MIALAAAAASAGQPSPAVAQEQAGPLRVYVIVLDGLKPTRSGR